MPGRENRAGRRYVLFSPWLLSGSSFILRVCGRRSWFRADRPRSLTDGLTALNGKDPRSSG